MNRREFVTVLPPWLAAINMALSNEADAQGYSYSNGFSAPLAYTNKNVTGPVTAPNSTSAYTMMGLSGVITPSSLGILQVNICGTIGAAVTGTNTHGISYQIFAGTGAAPTSNHAQTGSGFGIPATYENGFTVTSSADLFKPFAITALVTGLISGTTYWIDLAAKAITASGDVRFSNANISAREIQ